MLSVQLLAVVISLSLFFLMLSLSHCVDESMQSSVLSTLLFPSFLDTKNLSFLGCRALYTVINFFILWSICLSFYLVYFKNDPEY